MSEKKEFLYVIQDCHNILIELAIRRNTDSDVIKMLREVLKTDYNCISDRENLLVKKLGKDYE